MRRAAILFTLALFAALSAVGAALAHETPIAVLRIKQERDGRFYTQWIFQSDKGLPAPTALYPRHCVQEPPVLDCGTRGLVGTISVEQLDRRYSGVVIQLARAGEQVQAFTLTPGNPSITLNPGGGTTLAAIADLMQAYILIGFEHIMLGVDHLMFVLGLIWLVRSRWMLVKTITAFTVAHSVTLAAATLGWVGVPERAVNAAIALSIVFVGVEIIKLQRGRIGLTVRHPWLVAFAFGLLHGFGFSNALTKLGLPQDSILLALLSFNIGVEIGQIAFVCVVLAIQWGHRVMTVNLGQRFDPVPAYAIGAIAMFWFIDRMSMMFVY